MTPRMVIQVTSTVSLLVVDDDPWSGLVKLLFGIAVVVGVLDVGHCVEVVMKLC